MARQQAIFAIYIYGFDSNYDIIDIVRQHADFDVYLRTCSQRQQREPHCLTTGNVCGLDTHDNIVMYQQHNFDVYTVHVNLLAMLTVLCLNKQNLESRVKPIFFPTIPAFTGTIQAPESTDYRLQ